MDSIQLGIHLLFVGLLLGASTTNACSPDSGDTDGDGSNEQCVDELPTDYNCTDKTCDDWADGGHCTHWWQKSPAHRHCTTSNETIMNHCKKACDNCDSETTENQNVSTTNSMNSTEMMTENVTTVAQDDGTTMSPENTTQAVNPPCSNCTGCSFAHYGDPCYAYSPSSIPNPEECTAAGGIDCSDPCANVTCVGGFTCSNGTCLCGGSACDATANVCTNGTCECGSTGEACTAISRLSACLDGTGMTAAADDMTATCQCSGRLTANDTCADTTLADHDATLPLCGTDGTCGACQANADGTGGTGNNLSQGTCQNATALCCTDGSCDVTGSCL